MKTTITVFLGLAAAGCGGSATLTESQEYYMARGVAALAIEKDHLWTDEKVEEYLTLVGLSIAFESDRAETYKGYHFAVLNTDDVNAFAAPSGFIFVTKGALRSMNNEDELAGVLAHEIAHVNLRHPELAANRAAETTGLMEGVKLLNGVAGVGSFVLGALGKRQAADSLQVANEYAGQFGESLVEGLAKYKLGYSRDEELAADKTAVDFVTRPGVGYDPNAFRAFISRLPSKADSYGTHPGLEGRLQLIDDEIKKHKAAPVDAERTKRFLAMKAGLGQ
jgi:predicted Zn-dependent protease